MTAPRFDALAGRLLSRWSGAEADAPSAEARARAISAIETAIRRKNRRRLATRVTFAAAAVVLLGLGVRYLSVQPGASPIAFAPPDEASPVVTVVGHPTGAGATVVDTGAPSPLADGRALAPGSRILARRNGHVVLSVSTGTRLSVEEGGDVSIVDNGANEVFAIHAGAVRAEVAKLALGQRFIIQTPDSEVEVRGTSFRVAMAEADPNCEGGTVTRVSVYEGVVSVRHGGREARVTAGQTWPSGCVAEPAAPEALGQRPSVGVGAPSARRLAAQPSSALDAPLRAASDLKAQNDAFAQAVAAKQRGATREAIMAFEAFVAQYPSSSLVESALAQRMRLLGRVDAGRAADAADQYLARYPRGFARAEAETLARLGQ